MAHLLLMMVLSILALAASIAVVNAKGHTSHHHPAHTTIGNRQTKNATAASTAYFQETYYSGSTTCSGEKGQVYGNYSVGVCLPDGSGSYAWYCDNQGGYFVHYINDDCSGTINEIRKYDLGCSTSIGSINSVAKSCLSPPFTSWPPPGYITTTKCTNAGSCSTSDGGSCLHTAVPANECLQSNSKFANSQMTFCTADSGWIGVASYSSNDCSDPAPLSVNLISTECNSTTSNVQCAGTPLTSSLYPQVGVFMTSTSSSCQVGPGSSIQYQQSGVCFNYFDYTCAEGSSSSQIGVISSQNMQCQGNTTNYETNECLTETSFGQSNIFFCDGYQN